MNVDYRCDEVEKYIHRLSICLAFSGSILFNFVSVLSSFLVCAGLNKRTQKPLGAHQKIRVSQVKENTANEY